MGTVRGVITWRSGVVVEASTRWKGTQHLEVTVGDKRVRALSYPELVGDIRVGQQVLLNVSALERGLGTGGFALVVAPSDDLPADPVAGPGHLVKARYTPQQTMVLGVDEQESPHHELLAEADDLAGMPVVVADLHSALPAVVAGARHAAMQAGAALPRIVYLLTDGGALPAAFSAAVAKLRDEGWLDSCISTGQSFGGDLEAVNVHSGLLAAHLVQKADLVVLAQGPGNLGTGTRWGFSGVAAGEALNAVGVLGGQAVASLRVSGSDLRERHLGVSHHSLTAYGRVAHLRADVVVPQFEPEYRDLQARISSQVEILAAKHRLVDVPAGQDLLEALAQSPVRLSTMGRGLEVDPTPFLAAAAAGVHAYSLSRRHNRQA